MSDDAITCPDTDPGYQLGFSIGYVMARNSESGRKTLTEGFVVYDSTS